MVSHPKGFLLRVHLPVTLFILHVQTILGVSSIQIGLAELAHTSRAADIASHDGGSSFVDQQASLNRSDLATLGAVKQVHSLPEGLFKLDGVGGTTEALEALS